MQGFDKIKGYNNALKLNGCKITIINVKLCKRDLFLQSDLHMCLCSPDSTPTDGTSFLFLLKKYSGGFFLSPQLSDFALKEETDEVTSFFTLFYVHIKHDTCQHIRMLPISLALRSAPSSTILNATVYCLVGVGNFLSLMC